MIRKSETATASKPGKEADPPAPEVKPAGHKASPSKAREPEPVRCSSPPCMMGEMDEILEQ